MSGYIQIYEEKCIKSQVSQNKIVTLIVEEKKDLKESGITKTVDGLVSTLVIGTYVIPIDRIRHIKLHELNKILTSYVVNGIITIIGYVNESDPNDEIIYCEQLGENVTLNVNPMAVEIIKKKK